MGRTTEYTFFQRRYTDDEQAHEEMLNMDNYQRNANQSHNEISPHARQNGYNPRDPK